MPLSRRALSNPPPQLPAIHTPPQPHTYSQPRTHSHTHCFLTLTTPSLTHLQTPSQIPLLTHMLTTHTAGTRAGALRPCQLAPKRTTPACPPACRHTGIYKHFVNTLCSPTALRPSAFPLCGFNPTAVLVPSLSTPPPLGKVLGDRRPHLLRTGSLGCSHPCQVGGILGTKAWWEPLEDIGIVGIVASSQRHGRGRGKPGAFVCLWGGGGTGSPCHPSTGYPPVLIFDPGGLKGGKSQLSHCESQGAREHSQHWLPECQKLLLAPEEPKLAVELDCLKLAALGAPLAPMSQAPSGMGTRA